MMNEERKGMQMRIQELERLTGSDQATIRFYEKEGLITPRRLENGYRDYSQANAEELRKILLLRELGVTIETIRKLQQGSADFGQVMEQQARILSNRSRQMQRASAVCQEISGDSADYETLDTAHYQALLSAPELPEKVQTPTPAFREPVQEPPHPWRRFFARMIDHGIVNAAVFFAAVVLFRWRPVGNFLILAVRILGWALLIPLESASLHLCGTTPGKWIMGIQIERYEGGWLSWSQAFERTWQAVWEGVGFGIPILQEILLVHHYCTLTGRSMFRFQRGDDIPDPAEMVWEGWYEVSYRGLDWKRLGTGALTVVLCLGIVFLAAMDAVLPAYRGNDLNIYQFSGNFNQMESVLNRGARTMQQDGTFTQENYTTYTNLSNGESLEIDPFWQFSYEEQQGRITSVSDHHRYYELWAGRAIAAYGVNREIPLDAAGNWLSVDHRNAIIAMAAAQPGMNAKKLELFLTELEEKLSLPAGDGVQWEYGSLTFYWKINPVLYYDDGQNSSVPVYDVTLDFEIHIS